MLKAILFDRDGVLIKNYGYLIDIKKIKWLKGSVQAIKKLNYLKIKVIVITNQSGIGRGFYSSKKVEKLHSLINNDIIKEYGHIDEFVYAPFYKYSKLKFTYKDKLMRKPNKGMITYLLKKWNIDKKKSLVVGDKETDKKLANNCKIQYFDVNHKNHNLLNFLKKLRHG